MNIFKVLKILSLFFVWSMMAFTIFSFLFVEKVKNKVVSSDPGSGSESCHEMYVQNDQWQEEKP